MNLHPVQRPSLSISTDPNVLHICGGCGKVKMINQMVHLPNCGDPGLEEVYLCGPCVDDASDLVKTPSEKAFAVAAPIFLTVAALVLLVLIGVFTTELAQLRAGRVEKEEVWQK